jgi:hypothetical protein
VFQDLNSRKKIGSARIIDGLYYFEDEVSKDKRLQGLSSISSNLVKDEIMLWHYRLGHPNFLYLKKLFPTLFKGIGCSLFNCEHYILSKSHRSNYPSKTYQPSRPFYLIHSDVWGPSRIPTFSNEKWFVTFIDDHTRLCWVYLMTDKFEVKTVFQNFYNMIEN